ncbi:MAG: hypothetical protein ACO2O1_04115 [Candidatus Caldarchaeales archaeon]
MRSVRKELDELSEGVLALRRSYEEGSLDLDEYLERRFVLEVVHTSRAVSSLRKAFYMD